MRNPSEPIRLQLLDGTEGEFLLSMPGLSRLKKQFGAANLKELFDRDIAELAVPMLFEAWRRSGSHAGMKIEDFAELVPGDLLAVGKAVSELIGISFPDIDPSLLPQLVTKPTGT